MFDQAQNREHISYKHQIYRSFLYCSGVNLNHFYKACETNTDAISIDLEDTVPIQLKAQARQDTCSLIRENLNKHNKPLFVKINPISSKYGVTDLESLSEYSIAGIRVPKVNDTREVEIINSILDNTAFKGCIQLMIETAPGVLNMKDISFSSKYTSALIVGERDLSHHLGCDLNEIGYVLSLAVICSRAANLLPPILCGDPILDIEKNSVRSLNGKRKGFWGQLCVHPSQIDIVNELFTPSADEIICAKNVITMLEESERQGKTAIRNTDGNYISVWALDRANRVLALADAVSKLQ